MSTSISILVAAYNAAPYIDDCLRQIVGQMQARHELIVIDDGSRDATAERVAAIVARHPQLRIVLRRQSNQGIAAARNAALALAVGDYIAFIDSDDHLLPGALAALDAAIADGQPDCIATAFRMWHPERPDKDREVQMSYPPGQRLQGQAAILAPFFADRHTYIWCKVMRRAIYQSLGRPVFPPQRVFEDVSVLPRLLARCANLVYLPVPLLAYRQHPTSITRVITPAWCRDFVTALAEARVALQGDGVDAAVCAQLDVAAAYFYLGALKNSYQLPQAQGGPLRRQMRATFVAGLSMAPAALLAAMDGEQLVSNDRRRDRRAARQLRQALAGSWWFGLRYGLSHQFKLWQRLRRTRAQAA